MARVSKLAFANEARWRCLPRFESAAKSPARSEPLTDAGVVHRDLKPDNVFLTVDPDIPGGERIQLLDFGIAKLLGDEDASAALTRTGTVLGTPLYMSPEQCRGKSDLDGRTDLYALGCMLYQMLAGRPPFSGESALEVGAAHVRDEPEPVGNLCNGLADEIAVLVHQLLAKEPDERPASAGCRCRTPYPPHRDARDQSALGAPRCRDSADAGARHRVARARQNGRRD